MILKPENKRYFDNERVIKYDFKSNNKFSNVSKVVNGKMLL